MVATANSAYFVVYAQTLIHWSLMLIKTQGSKAGYNKALLACKKLSMPSVAGGHTGSEQRHNISCIGKLALRRT